MSSRRLFNLLERAWLIAMPVLALMLLSAKLAHCQTLTVQSGVGVSHALGNRAGPLIEGRVTLPWLYTRLFFSGEPKVYLRSGNTLTGDVLARVPYRGAWFGGGLEIASTHTSTYSKTARRILFGGGVERASWSVGAFAFLREFGTPNASYGGRVEVSGYHRWLAVTVRPYVLRYHDSNVYARVGTGGGVEVLAGVRWKMNR